MAKDTPKWEVDDEGHLNLRIWVSENAYLLRRVPDELASVWYERALALEVSDGSG